MTWKQSLFFLSLGDRAQSQNILIVQHKANNKYLTSEVAIRQADWKKWKQRYYRKEYLLSPILNHRVERGVRIAFQL